MTTPNPSASPHAYTSPGVNATKALAELLDDLADRARWTPCQREDGWAWISENAAERREAAEACDPCPLRLPCLAAGIEQDDRHTARGGHDLGTPAHRRAAVVEIDTLTRQERTQ